MKSGFLTTSPSLFALSRAKKYLLTVLLCILTTMAVKLEAQSMQFAYDMDIYSPFLLPPFPLYQTIETIVTLEGDFEAGPTSNGGLPILLFQRGQQIDLTVKISSISHVFDSFNDSKMKIWIGGVEREVEFGAPTVENWRREYEGTVQFPAFQNFTPNNDFIDFRMDFIQTVFAFEGTNYYVDENGGTAPSVTITDSSNGAGVIGTQLQELIGVTQTPSLPQFILHNPPGDESITYYSSGEEICTTQNFTFNEGSEEEYSASVKLGASGTVPLVGSDYEAYLEISGTANIGTNETTEGTTEICQSVTSTWENSGGEYTGSDGDVYVGYAMEFDYGVSKEVYYDGGSSLSERGDLAMFPKGATTFAFSEAKIRNDLIPAADIRAENMSNTAEIRAQAAQEARIWREALDRNADTYAEINANPNGSTNVAPLFIEGGITVGAVDREFVEVNAYSTSIELFVDKELMIAAGVEVGGSGVSGYAAVRGSLSNSVTHESSTAGSTAIGYLLQDDNPGDEINGTVHMDRRFGTYIFQVNEQTSQTSCPYEVGQTRDAPRLTIDAEQNTSKTIYGAPIQDGAAITLNICSDNTSNDETRNYYLRYIESQSAGITYSNQSIGDEGEIINNIPKGGCREESIVVTPIPGTTLYEGIQLVLEDACDDVANDNDVESETLFLDVLFGGRHPDAQEYDDPCAAANVLTNGSVHNGYTNVNAVALNYTTQNDHSRNERRLAEFMNNDCGFGWCDGFVQIDNSVWFSFVAPESGYVDISTVHAGTSFDTQMALYDVGNCEDFTTYSLLYANDDAAGDGLYRSKIEYSNLAPGEIYYILVDGYNGENGTIAISISSEDPSADDDGDGVPNTQDLCEGSDDNIEFDGDGIPDDCDACPELGRIGLAFDGVNDHLDGVELENFDGATNTIEMWLYMDALPADHRSWPLFLGAWGSGQHWIINTDGTTSIGSFNTASHNPVLPINEWVHIATTYQSGVYNLYLNGVLYDSMEVLFSYPTPRLSIGGLGFGGDEYHNGRLDEVRVWNVARTPQQIAESFNKELSGSESGLIAYYNFAEGLPNDDNTCLTVVKDKVGSNDFTMNGFLKIDSGSNWAEGAPILPRFENDNDEGNACFIERNLGFMGIEPDTIFTTNAELMIDLPAIMPNNGSYSGDHVIGNTFDVQAAGVGAFEVIYTVLDINSGCSVSDLVVVFVDVAIATEDIFTSSNVSIWPNPTKDRVNILFSDIEAQPIQISLWTSIGQLVQKEKIASLASNVEHELSLETLPEGLYWILFESEDGTRLGQRKIVKQ